jgi:magnesium-transporting ATPase (P-type)
MGIVQGVKLGDLQATVMGMLSAVLFFVISHAKPLDKLSPQRPHPNIWSAYVFLSLLGQFAVHMAYLIYMYFGALAAMPKVGSPPSASTVHQSGMLCTTQGSVPARQMPETRILSPMRSAVDILPRLHQC